MIVRLALFIVPRRWRASVAQDLREEAVRRPRAVRVVWYAGQALRIGGKLRWADWREHAVGLGAFRGTRHIGLDVKLAIRGIRRQPGSSTAIVLTLALGIGATSATYAVFNAALFRPVPGVVDPDRLLSIYPQPDEHTPSRTGVSFAHLTAMRAGAEAVTGIADYSSNNRRLQTAADGDPFVATGSTVSRDFFQTLGVRPTLGRLIASDEYQAAGARVAVISERLWRARFGAASAIVGRSLWVNGVRFEIVGVAAGFQGLDLRGRDDFWLPYAADRLLEPAIADEPDEVFTMIGRLRPGAILDVARIELSRTFDSAGVIKLFSGPNSQVVRTITAVAFPGLSDGIGMTEKRLMTMYHVLMGGVALLLVLACANAANLLLGRNIRRRRDLALRAAIGATRGRLFRELIVEATLLSAGAGGIGLAMGAVLSGLFRGERLLSYMPALDDIALDWRVAAVAFSAAVATIFVFALVPAWLASGERSQNGLRDSSRASGRASRLRPLLMIAQVAISLVLLVGTTLLARTVAHLRGVDLGIDTHNVWSVDLRPPLGRAGAVIAGARDQLSDRAGDANVAVANPGLFTGTLTSAVVRAGEAAASATRLATYAVSPSFFATMRMPILAGRSFTAAEGHAQEQGLDTPAILGELAARRLFGSPEASLGRQLFVVNGRKVSWHVVGVTNDIAGYDLRLGRQPSAFIPYAMNARVGSLVIQTSLGRGDATALVREAVRRVDGSVPVETLRPMNALVDDQLSQELLLARLGGVVTAIAALLALTGVYAVMAFFVAERTRELGIRRALGATGTHVVSQVFRRVLTMSLIGLGCGLAISAAVARSLSSWLFGVSASDPITLIGAVATLLVSALAAAAIPARRASRVEPAIALRVE